MADQAGSDGQVVGHPAQRHALQALGQRDGTGGRDDLGPTGGRVLPNSFAIEG